jgi:hypothetical protein
MSIGVISTVLPSNPLKVDDSIIKGSVVVTYVASVEAGVSDANYLTLALVSVIVLPNRVVNAHNLTGNIVKKARLADSINRLDLIDLGERTELALENSDPGFAVLEHNIRARDVNRDIVHNRPTKRYESTKFCTTFIVNRS